MEVLAYLIGLVINLDRVPRRERALVHKIFSDIRKRQPTGEFQLRDLRKTRLQALLHAEFPFRGGEGTR
jgi:hypothetical protein